MPKLKAFKRSPSVHSVMYLTDPTNTGTQREIVDAQGNSRWVPCRSEGLGTLRHRIKCAWLVFTGRADALTWPEDQ